MKTSLTIRDLSGRRKCGISEHLWGVYLYLTYIYIYKKLKNGQTHIDLKAPLSTPSALDSVDM